MHTLFGVYVSVRSNAVQLYSCQLQLLVRFAAVRVCVAPKGQLLFRALHGRQGAGGCAVHHDH